MSSTQQPTDSTENNQPTPTAQKSGLSRRDPLRRSAVGGATLAGVSTGAIRLDHGPVQESEAIAPAVVAGGVGASAAVGWAVREYEIVGSDDPPSGQTPEALENELRNRFEMRESDVLSTIKDNENILEGINHTAWADGKIAAIEELNNQESQDAVEQAAQDAVDEYDAVVTENLLKSWDEMAQDFYSMQSAVIDHPDLDVDGVFAYSDTDLPGNNDSVTLEEVKQETETKELANGNTYEYFVAYDDNSIPEDEKLTPLGGGSNRNGIRFSDYEDEEAPFLFRTDDWEDIMDAKNEVFDEVRDGMSVWVDGVYADVQAGELDTDELLTPREQAELTSDDEDFPQAVADLQALNVSVDLEREAEIYLPDVEATVWGQIGYGGDDTIETGTINPDNKDGSIYFTYDISQGQGEWSAYDEGIDGGELTFTAEPFVDTIYYVDTVAGETVELTADDFEETDDGDEWTVDLSDDLDDAITDVYQIEYYAETEETQYETIQLQDQFEIATFEDSDGEEYDSADFERSEPHSDDNYITEEEWQEQQERHEELIEQYEDAQGGGSIPGFGDVLDGEANGLIGIAVVGVVLVSAILSALNPLS